MSLELEFDLADIADVGARSDKLAGEILSQIRRQWGSLPLPVPLSRIAAALGITEIEERDTDSFEGALVALPDKSKGVIVLRSNQSLGRRNFTLGHELGHFVNPFHQPPREGFYCNSKALTQRREGKAWKERSPFERMEVEANEFSSFLNVPRLEFATDMIRHRQCDIGSVVELAARYAVSKEMMAQIYVQQVSQQVAIITSRNGAVARSILPKSFPYLGIRKGQRLPEGSITNRFQRKNAPGASSCMEEVEAALWINNPTSDQMLFEQVLVQRDGWALTMLLVETDGSAADEENEDTLNGWPEPRFAYGR